MALVVQLINRAGAIIGSHSFQSDRIMLGRALDCDLVLQDPHVEAHHLEVVMEPESGRLSCRDLGSLNGTWRRTQNSGGTLSKKKTAVTGITPFFSGQIFELGKTHVRVCSSQHAVAPALPLSRWEALGHALAHWWIYCTLALLLLTLQVWDNYLSEPNTKKLYQYTLSALYPLLAAIVYAGVWAFIGRNIRHDGKFTSHMTAALAAVLAVSAFEFSAPYWAFNWSVWRWQSNSIAVFTAAIVFLLGFVTLSFATHLKALGKTAVALVAPMVLLIPTLLQILGEPEFRSIPPYDRSLVEPDWQFKKSNTVEEFLAATPSLYPLSEEALGSDPDTSTEE